MAGKEATESDFAPLFSGLDLLAQATEGAVHVATTLDIDIDSLDNTGVLNAVSANAELVRKNLASIAEASEKVSTFIVSLKKTDIKKSSQQVANEIGSLAAKASDAGATAFEDLTRSALTGQGAPNFSVAQTVSLFDAQPSGLAFGYQPAQDAIKSAIGVFGADSDVGKWLQGAQGTFEDIGAAVPFLNIAVGLIMSQLDTVSANNEETIRRTDAYIHRQQAARAQRRNVKEGVSGKSNSLIRVDGLAYKINTDSRIRDLVIAGRSPYYYEDVILPSNSGLKKGVGHPWKWGKGRPERKQEFVAFGDTNVSEAINESLDWVAKNLGDDKWALRSKARDAYLALQEKEYALVVGGQKGKLFDYVDGGRSFEHAKDTILLKLMAAKAIHVREVQALAGGADDLFGNYRAAQTDNEQILYAISAPGASLWTYWSQLATKRASVYKLKVTPKLMAKAFAKPSFFKTHQKKIAVATALAVAGLGLIVGRKVLR